MPLSKGGSYEMRNFTLYIYTINSIENVADPNYMNAMGP